jgi:hypothetical protein
MNHVRHTGAGLIGAPVLFAALSFFSAPGQSATWKPDPSLGNPAQHLRLYDIGRRYGDEHYDEAVGLTKNRRNPQKSSTHMLRESAYYAYGLLLTGDPEDRKRAERIIRLILSRQDLRSDKPTYGCLPPYYEDDWAGTAVIDPNYTQFVGSAIGEILDLDRKQNNVLSKDLRQQIETAFRLAVLATMRRDVDPGYTNISLLSAATAAQGDKLLGVPGARDFALSKLYWILTRAQPNTTFTEYLSPTYYGVDLHAAYLVRKFASSPEVATAANRMIDFLWQDIAGAYHAPTLQLAGPHSRSYGVDMTKYTAGLKYFLFLALDGKYPLVDVETDHDWDSGVLPLIADLPVELRPELRKTPPPWREVAVNFRADNSPRQFRQYRSGNFVLGSMSDQSLWQQQRNVVAYWPGATPDSSVRFFQDMSPLTFGNGYAHFVSVQSKAAVLVAMTGKDPIPAQGGLRLGFNHEAQAKPFAGGPPGSYAVDDAGVTAYIYPVTQANGAMSVRTEGEVTYLERPWASGDPVGNFHVLSYLVVFQLPGEAAPVVKNLSFAVADGKATMSAEANGTPLSLQVSRG